MGVSKSCRRRMRRSRRRAPSYFRSWSSQSQPGPVTDYPPYPAPPIVYAPTLDGDRNHGQKGHQHQSLNSKSSAGRPGLPPSASSSGQLRGSIMSFHRSVFVALATVFAVGMAPAAFAQCCGYQAPAPVYYAPASGCGGCGQAYHAAPAFAQGGCGSCGATAYAPIVYATPIAPAPIAVGSVAARAVRRLRRSRSFRQLRRRRPTAAAAAARPAVYTRRRRSMS